MIPGLAEQPILPCDAIAAIEASGEVVLVGVQMNDGRAHVVLSVSLTPELAKELLLDLGSVLSQREEAR